ncbi:MAG: BatA and WFA domain-containing protein [Anaerolineae bacterium]
MSFLTPAFAALAALAIPIIVLYMLRLRRREVPISSTMLWQRLMQDREANAPWQKLRRSLLLLLQLLTLAVLVVALMRPFLPVPSVAAGSVALLIDASASMNAADLPGGATRFEAARDQARALVTDLAAGEVMTVIAVGPTPQVLTPPTADPAALREAIGRAAPTAAPADWEAALALAAASIAGRPEASIVILSDGGLPADLPPLPAPVRYVRVGQGAENVAVSALAVRPLDGAPQLFAAVTNYGTRDAHVILSIEADGALQTAERLSVPAGDTADLTLTDLPREARIFRAALSAPADSQTPDYLALDDSAYAVFTPPAGGSVLLVTEGNLFLEQLLAALPTLESFRAAPGDLPDRAFDLVVFDGWLPDDLPATNLLIINPPTSTDLFLVGEAFSTTRFVRQADDPILSFVDFQSVAIREARLVQPAGWAQPLVEAEGGPLLLAGTVGGRRVAILPFDLRASDLPLRIDFPILFANLLDWYAPAQPFEAAGGLAPGDPLVIRPRPLTTQYRITLPDGTVERFPASAETLIFTGTGQIGVYTVELLEGLDVQMTGSFAVNLFAPGESRIAPQEAIQIGEAPITPNSPQDQGQRELWPWLAAAALVLLIVEWWVYHRGSVISRRERERVEQERAGRPGLLYPGRRQ